MLADVGGNGRLDGRPSRRWMVGIHRKLMGIAMTEWSRDGWEDRMMIRDGLNDF